jgi:tripartite-type tricarboxylate transporter receptor subunit TctC
MLKSFVSRRLLLASAAALAVTPLWAQPSQPSYPSKPIRLVIGYAPGGSVDMVGRVIADILTKHLDATVVVENQAGAAGVIAAQRVVSSKADGYTLLAGSSNELAGTKAVNTAQKYDPSKDVTPIGLAALAPNMWVAGAHVPAKNIEEFVALVKKNPGKYSYGSPGIGSTPHFSGELIKKTAGLFITHIPYRGSATMTTDLGGGNVDFALPAKRPHEGPGRHDRQPPAQLQGCAGAGRASGSEGLCAQRLVCPGRTQGPAARDPRQAASRAARRPG